MLKYKDHPSIKSIEKISQLNSLFRLCTDVPTKIIKENADIFADFIQLAINTSINTNEFPSLLKLAGVIPVFKKG